MKKFKDELRIPYLDTTTARNADRRTFEDYREGIITPETGACLIGKHNRVEVTVEQFIANADWLGYRRGGYEHCPDDSQTIL